MAERRTVGKLRQKFETSTSVEAPAEEAPHHVRLSLPAYRFRVHPPPQSPPPQSPPQSPLPAANHTKPDPVEPPKCNRPKSSSDYLPAPRRTSRVSETVQLFDKKPAPSNKSVRKFTHKELAALRNNRGRSSPRVGIQGGTSDSAAQSTVTVVSNTSSSSTVTHAPGRVLTATRTTTQTTTVRRFVTPSSPASSRASSAQEPRGNATANNKDDDEPVKLRRPPAFFPAGDTIGGEQIIVQKMKEEEQQFDRRDRYQSIFQQVPLYQTYSKEVIRRESGRFNRREAQIISSDLFDNLDIPAIDESPSQSLSESGSHERNSHLSNAAAGCRLSDVTDEPTRLSDSGAAELCEAAADSEPLTRKLAGSGPARVTWAAMPEVQASGALERLTERERNWQELLFEVITSEASYFRSLHVLVHEFYKAPEFDPTNPAPILSAMQKVHLFSNILRINEMSENFLHDLEALWKKSPSDLTDVTKIIYEHAEKHFKDYVPYIRNQIYMNKALEQLDTNERFKEVVRNIQKKAECGHIWDFRSFILLPMQRVTRLKLLTGNILHAMTKAEIAESDARYKQGVSALNALVVVLQEAETEQGLMTQKEHLLTLINQLDWSAKLISISDKTLVREGKHRLLAADKSMNHFKKRPFFSSKPLYVHLFLFNDLLLVAKMKTNGRYVVIDHCPRAALTANPLPPDSHPNAKFPFALDLLENHLKSKEHLEMDAETSTEQERWLSVLCPSMKKEHGECEYEEWDRPKVLVTREYNASQPDELNLKEGELYSVERKTADGWYLGTDTSGRSGWFPVRCTVEKEDDHVRYRLLRNLAKASSGSQYSLNRPASTSSSPRGRRPSAPQLTRGYTIPPEPL